MLFLSFFLFVTLIFFRFRFLSCHFYPSFLPFFPFLSSFRFFPSFCLSAFLTLSFSLSPSLVCSSATALVLWPYLSLPPLARSLTVGRCRDGVSGASSRPGSRSRAGRRDASMIQLPAAEITKWRTAQSQNQASGSPVDVGSYMYSEWSSSSTSSAPAVRILRASQPREDRRTRLGRREVGPNESDG